MIKVSRATAAGHLPRNTPGANFIKTEAIMKTILVPTDFSPSAANALNLAMKIARNQEAKLLLLNVYRMPVIISPASYDVMIDQELNDRRTALYRIKAECERIRYAGGIEYGYLVQGGSVTDVILKVIKEHRPDLVVMGTGGADSVTDWLLGTHTAQVLQQSTRPVLSVPESASFHKPIRRITYATNYTDEDIQALRALCDITAPLNAQVTALHISGHRLEPEYETWLMGEFMTKALGQISYPHLTFNLIYGNDVADRLEEYVRQGETDLLVLSTRHLPFLQRIYKRSVTKRLASRSAVPIVAFHHYASEMQEADGRDALR
jgi:nucleotide-binding universal stress UspA family protein